MRHLCQLLHVEGAALCTAHRDMVLHIGHRRWGIHCLLHLLAHIAHHASHLLSHCAAHSHSHHHSCRIHATATAEGGERHSVDARLRAAAEYVGPVYMRLGRLAVPVVNDEENYTFEIGKGEILRDGTDVAIIANGLMVYEAIQAGEMLSAKGINAMIINMATVKPLDEELVIAAAKKCGKVITCEEHSIIGGLGEAVASCLSEKLPTPVKRIGVNDEFGHSGPALDLLKEFGLTAEHIVEVVKEKLGK